MAKKNIKKNTSGMIDISGKKTTRRKAICSCKVIMSKKTLDVLVSKGSPKGDVFECARIAGIMAAKATPQIIPMCHPLALNKVDISFEINKRENAVVITSEVRCLGKTGVEMEALTACSVSALTIYDMMKWLDRTMIISDLKLLHKSGGKSGVFNRR